MQGIQRLLDVMARLRDPEHGCPWDREQTFQTILPYTLEEVYEVAEAIDRNDMDELREELGDLLFQIVFYAQIAKETGEFDFEQIADSISEKLIQRHPHVFSGAEIDTAEAQTQAWEKHKERERSARAAGQNREPSVLDNVPVALPGIMRAMKLQRRAARVGFDWPDILPVLDKIEEELAEVREVIDVGGDPEKMQHEIGDLLFACVNLGLHANVDAEVALRGVNQRFETRFRRVEVLARQQGRALSDMTLEEMDRLWDQAKTEETKGREG
jgi:ATP diphosphatase